MVTRLFGKNKLAQSWRNPMHGIACSFSLYKCIQMQNMEDMQNLDLEYFESEFE